MNLIIDRADETVALDNARMTIELGEFLPDDVEMVSWTGALYHGQIEYNDRARLLEKFHDISPFHPVIQTFMRHSPGMTLAQAKQLKIELMESMAGADSRAPIKVELERKIKDKEEPLVISHYWSARDIDISAAATDIIPNIIGTVDKEDSGWTHTVAMINMYGNATHSSVEIHRASLPRGAINRLVYTNIVGLGNLFAGPGLAAPYAMTSMPWAVAGPGGGKEEGGVGVGDGGTAWPTTDTLEFIDLTNLEASTIMNAISTRAGELTSVFYRKVGDVLSLTTIQDVINYDVLEGWGVRTAELRVTERPDVARFEVEIELLFVDIIGVLHASEQRDTAVVAGNVHW